jgi:hypothetical protein
VVVLWSLGLRFVAANLNENFESGTFCRRYVSPQRRTADAGLEKS